ncbi:MAG TPA: cysteine hydrolase [Acidimicrobiales bacterium]|jgi:nicotinamidase-related amidase|nr:cysteine hydrolase [Acidimicrobiales bacterium]
MALKPELVAPGHTAVVINECQRMVVEDMSMLPELVESAAPMLDRLGALVKAARAADVQVIHCVVQSRPDGRGANHNTRMHAVARKRQGSGESAVPFDVVAGAQVAKAIGTDPSDLVLSRIHGMSPMTDTGLDPILRNLGVTTIVACGVSINVGLTNLVMDSVNRGYDVVVPRDGAAGVPREYGESVLENSIAMIARLTSTDELADLWAGQ